VTIREIILIVMVIGIFVVLAECIYNVPVNTSQNDANSTPSGVNKTYYINGFNFTVQLNGLFLVKHWVITLIMWS
jgi:hypothetical protein